MFKKILIFITIVSVILVGGSSYYYAQNGSPLSESVLRLHVIANSDSIGDQALKIEVKNKIVEYMAEKFAGQQDVNQAREIAIENRGLIQEIAEGVVAEAGYNYPVKIEVGNYLFPTKSYGNLVFPQGEYQAVRVIIGTGEGKNWWCVLFPPLCMVADSDKGLTFQERKEASVSLKCLELIPKGVKLKVSFK